MNNLALIVIGLLVGIAQFSSIAIAESQQVAIAESGAYPKAYLTAFHGNQTTLTDAINAIERRTSGKVIEIRFAAPNDKPGFHTVVAQRGEVKFARIELPSKHVSQLTENPDWMLKWQQRTEVRLATKAPVPLSQAIQTAEAAQGAPAIAAGLATPAPGSEVVAYNIMLDDRGSLKRLAVDSSTGQIISDLQGFEQWPQW
jgi:uncharacterized membrane protein YkoI